MTLRPYQRRAADRVREALSWHHRVCLVMPTGAGKTVTAAAVTEGRDALWLVHTTVLRRQLESQRRRVVTVQSLLRGKRPDCDILVADECHHLATSAAAWNAVAESYPCILGLTATPCRGDNAPLGDLFRYLVVGSTYSELLAGGWLAPCRVVQPVDVPEREDGLAEHPVAAWQKYAAGRRGFAFFGRVELARKFVEAVPRSAVVSGEQSQRERDETIEAFEAGDLDVLASVRCLSEGVDLPEADVAMLARGVSHEGAYLQMVGRILRPGPGKVALLIDLPGASLRFGFPTDDRVYSLDGSAVGRAGGAPSLSQCLQCGFVFPAGPTCPECGWVRPVKVRPPRIWGVPMEEVDPAALTPEQRAKMRWKERMLADDDARLAYFLRTTKSAKQAFVKHRAMFGADMPTRWWGMFKRKVSK